MPLLRSDSDGDWKPLSDEASLPSKIMSTARRFAQDVLQFLDQPRRCVGRPRILAALREFEAARHQEGPEKKNLHLQAFRSQIHRCVVPRQALNVSSGYQQIRRALLDPVYRLPRISGSHRRISLVLQRLLK